MKQKTDKPVKKSISRREALRLIALSVPSFLVSCFKNDSSISMDDQGVVASQTPSQTSTMNPDPTAATAVETNQEPKHRKPRARLWFI